MPQNEELRSDPHFQLWKSAESGDRPALNNLLRQLQDQIFRFCMSQLREEHLAIEATQETAVRLIENLQRFSGQGKVSTWVLGIANNVCREIRRRQIKLQVVQPDEIDIAVESMTPSLESKETMEQALGKLPDRQREAIVLRYYESLSLAEVADVMQVSLGTVKATLSQAIKKLKVHLPETL